MSQRIPPAQAAELSLATRLRVRPGRDSDLPPAEIRRVREQMRSALESFDETAADQVLQRIMRECSAASLIRQVILPSMREIGDRWATKHLTVAQEHFASNFLLFRLATLSSGWDHGLGPRALLACAPDEHHTLGLICFGIALHDHGWRIVYLGGATPVEMLASAARDASPDLITVCAYAPGRIEPFVDELRAIGRTWQLALAGPATSAELASKCGARHLSEDPIAAAATLSAAPLSSSSDSDSRSSTSS